MSWNDTNAMLQEDYDFEVANIFNQMQPIENLVATIQADRQHEFMLNNRARTITRGMRRAARNRRMVNAHYYFRERPYNEHGLTRQIQSYLR